MNDSPDHLHHRLGDRCQDCVVDAGAQLAALQKETSEQSVVLNKIALALIGDYEKQGLISRSEQQYIELKKEIADLKAWKDHIEKLKADLLGRMILYGIGAIIVLLGGAYMVIKAINV